MSASHAPLGDTLDLEWARIADIAARFVTTEYASLTRDGRPITWPVTPYPSADGRTIRVSTGLTYPLKAERARRNPKVALSFSEPVGSGVADAPTLVIQGLATVRDADLNATSADYLQASADRFPESFRSIPTFLLRRMDWYWTRMWVEVTPTRALWWPQGNLQSQPVVWNADFGVTAPPSDPAPTGRSTGSWAATDGDWRKRARGALERLGLPVVTTVGPDGWPLPWRAVAAAETASGYVLEPPAGTEVSSGPAFLTMHEHSEVFDGQENLGLTGVVDVVDGEVRFTPERSLADFGVPRSQLRSAVAMWRASRTLRPRLAHEVARRGQRVPSFDELGFVRPGSKRAAGGVSGR